MRIRLQLLLAVLLCPLFSLPALAQDSFRIVQFSGANVSANGQDQRLRDFVARINTMSPKPVLIIGAGNITASGAAEEYSKFRQSTSGISVPLYVVPGVHEVAAGSVGRRGFEAEYKKRYQSFDQGGCHLVLLDSTITNERAGHIDDAQIKWLEADLKKVKKGTSVLVFMYHPLGLDPDAIDNEDSVLRLLAPHRVIGVFSGNTQKDGHWKTNGINCFSVSGVNQGTIRTIDVTGESVAVSIAHKESNYVPESPVTIARGKPEFKRVAFLWDDPDVPLLSRRRPLTELRIGEKGLANDDKVKAEYQIDRRPPKPMDRDKRDTKSVSFMTQFETKELGVGGHRLRLLLTDPSSDIYRRDEYFAYEELRGSPRRTWEYPANVEIQGGALAADGTVYVGTQDGKVIAPEMETGKRRWEFNAKDAVIAAPVLSENSLFVGSMGGKLYCIDAKSGRERWSYDAGSAISGSTAVLSGVVCISVSDKLIGVNVQTGKEVWTAPFPGKAGCNVTMGNGVFVAFHDGEVRVVDAATGTAKWKHDDERGQGTGASSISTWSIASENGRLYFVRGGSLRAWDEKTGKDIWASPPHAEGERLIDGSPVVVADGKAIVCAAGDKGQGDCYAFSITDGKLAWRSKTGADGTEAKPALQGKHVVTSSREGKLTWIDLAGGEVKYSYRLDPGWCFASAATSGDRVFIGSLSGKLYGISLPTGSPADKPRIPIKP